MPQLEPGTLAPSEREDAAITSAARRDPDAKPLTAAEWKLAKSHARIGPRPKAVPKVPVMLRLDPDLVAALRAAGSSWQTRVNDALRATLRLGGQDLWRWHWAACDGHQRSAQAGG